MRPAQRVGDQRGFGVRGGRHPHGHRAVVPGAVELTPAAAARQPGGDTADRRGDRGRAAVRAVQLDRRAVGASAAPGRRRGNRTPPGWDHRRARSARRRRPAPAPAGPPAGRDAGRRRRAAAGPWRARRPAARGRWRTPPAPRRPVRRRPARARWPAGRRCRPPSAAASPARTAGRTVPRRPTPGARTAGRCAAAAAGPRRARRSGPAGRAARWRSPRCPTPGRSWRGPPRQRTGPVLEVTGQQLADDAVLLGAGDQPRRRIAGPRGRLPQHRERVAVHRAHQRLAHHGTARLPGPRLEQRGRQRAARGGGRAAPNPSAAEPIPGPSRRAMCAAAACDQQRALAGARATDDADHAAQPRRRARRTAAGPRVRARAGHVGMTPRGSDNSAGYWQHEAVTDPPRAPLRARAGPAQVLALHGLTGHGRRWRTLATRHLPDFAVVAPDLLGHGRSSWSAPWTFDANVAALAGVVENQADGPVVVVGHSFGGAVALHLAAARPDLVVRSGAARSGGRARRAVDARDRRRDAGDPRTTPTATRPAPRSSPGSWADVDAGRTRRRPRRASGRAAQRPLRLADQHPRDDVVLERAGPRYRAAAQGNSDDAGARAVDRPAVCDRELIDGLANRLGADFTLVDFDCDHMVAQAKPAETAAVIRDHLERR